MRFLVPLIVLALGASVPATPRQADAPGSAAINEAIDRGVEFLLRVQRADGSYGGANLTEYPEGGTPLVVAALVHSGVDPEHQAIQRAVAFVRSRPQRRYYGTTTRILMEDVLGPQQDQKALKESVEFILSGSGSGYYDYPMTPPKPDLSNTQYAILSLWFGHKNGIKVPDKAIESSLKAILAEQNRDGGWAYFPQPQSSNPGAISIGGAERHSTASMTTAGMSSLLFCMDVFAGNKKMQKRYADDVEQALEKGYGWLDKHMAYDKNVTLETDPETAPLARQWDYYYLYTIERLGTIAERDQLGGKDWYAEGARHLLKVQREDGSWVPERGSQETSTAFALLFLVRATRAVTGESGSRKSSVLAAVDPAAEEVDLRVLSGRKSVAWIAGFGGEVREAYGKKGQMGLRVEAVRYFMDGEEIGRLEGDVGEPSGSTRFEQALDPGPGDHLIQAVVTIAPEPEAGGQLSERRVELQSAVLKMRVDWALSDKDKQTLAELSANLIPGSSPEISVSSETENPIESGEMAVDGGLANGWVVPPDDPEPWIRLTWKKGLKAKTLVLSPVTPFPPMEDYYATPTKVSVKVNGKATQHTLQGESREHVDLGKVGAVKSLEIHILETRAGKHGDRGTGFAEIELIGKVKAKRRR